MPVCGRADGSFTPFRMTGGDGWVFIGGHPCNPWFRKLSVIHFPADQPPSIMRLEPVTIAETSAAR